MKAWCLGLLLLLLLLLYLPGYGQQEEKHFRAVSVDKGLSQSTVFTMQQDTLGFLWMGTQDGLNRYDGKRFTVYRPEKGNERSVRSYYIKTIFKDAAGQLWVGGNRGISRYHYDTDDFTNYTVPRASGEWYISAIAQDTRKRLWAASSTGNLFRLNASRTVFKPVPFDARRYGIHKVSYLGFWHGKLLLGTDAGIFQMKPGQAGLTRLGPAADVNDVLPDGEQLWLATEGNGLVKYEERTGQATYYRHIAGKNSLADNNVRGMAKDADGTIWLGTFRGLSILNPAQQKFENYAHQPSQPYTISQNSVRSVYRDRQNGMWLGTFYGGANYYHKRDIKFNLLSQTTGGESLNDQVVSAILEDGRGNFWIGTNDKGLNYWNKKQHQIRYYTASENNPDGLNANNIKALALDGKGRLLVGTHNGGLNLLDPATGKAQHFLHDEHNPQSIAGNLVYALLRDSKNRIWVGTRSGLDRFDPTSQAFTHIRQDSAGKGLPSNEITFLYEDSQHTVWIGTTNGVARLDPNKLLFDTAAGTQLADDVVNCIIEDARHRIWVGTRDGIRLYNPNSQQFTTYQNQRAPLRGTIYGIEPDEESNLWISTSSGLVKLNPDTRQLQVFGQQDGLQNNQFNEYAFGKATDGMLLFGGIGGLSYFYPAAIEQQRLPLSVRFTGLEVFNKKVVVGDGTAILPRTLNELSAIVMPSDYRQFSFVFNSFNYISANRTYYLYRLDGFDADWQKTDLFKASYTNVPPGDYTFSVKAIGPNGEASPTRSLNVRLLPPWYRATWFYLLLLLLSGISLYVAYRVLAERLRARQQLQHARLEKEKLNYINQVKMDFFTNVSHELRTPLTLILGPLEDILKKPSADKWLTKQHELMRQNAQRLYNLVDQLFEFRKTEAGTRKLQVAQGNLVGFVQEVYESFLALSERNSIQYTYHASPAQLSFLFDKNALERILFNLLSNAFKYTKPGGQIHVELTGKDQFAVVQVSDTGTGIASDALNQIFDRFYQVEGQEMNLGSGVGLAFTKQLVELHHGTISVSSVLGEGSTFTVALPTQPEYYQGDIQAEAVINDLPARPEQPALQLENDEAADQAQPLGLMTAKVLIVDDNEEIVSYLSGHFAAEYDVYTAANGKLAWELLQESPVDLVLSDIMMPEEDGLHFCKRLKQNINTSHIPVILLTAKAETQQQIKGYETGADDYVTKPFSISLLDIKVKNLLRSRRRLKEYYSANTEVVPENIAFNALDTDFLRRALQIVEEHLIDTDFSIDKLAQGIGMSRTNLYLKFKALTGASATDFIKKIRFNKAIELMQTREYTIAQITYMCGFNSPSYFSTAFKQHFGCVPSEYMKTA